MGSTMISRIFIKNYLGFKEVDLKIRNGLSVFTGVSGAGKSVLMDAILAVFGFKDCDAKLIEADVSSTLNTQDLGIENEDINTFKLLKDKSTRYFINNQSISKKNLSLVASSHLKYLSSKDIGEFENYKLIEILDYLITKKNSDFKNILDEFKKKNSEFIRIKKALASVNEEEKKIEELKEFANFEIEKISLLKPEIGEFEELIKTKKRLSKKDKIQDAWAKANQIFNYENAVIEALNISEIDAGFFSEAFNELKIKKSSVNFDDLENIDVEELLDRIEGLNGLIKRYGSIEESLEILKKRKTELEYYENIEFKKHELESKFKKLENDVFTLAKKMSKFRNEHLKDYNQILNEYLKNLYMNKLFLSLKEKDIDSSGLDKIQINLGSATLKTLSSGEINRLRLAFIAAQAKITEFGNGVLILDEIDANLSGKEAMSIAKVLLELAKFYQIFAISHQPQLSSKANSHFLVQKNDDISNVKLLNTQERVTELSRMISGEIVSKQAVEFARKLLDIKD